MLQVLDVHWKEHLAGIDHLRQSIGLRAYAQKNPKNEYKREAYSMFEEMLDQINKETVRILFTLQLTSPEEVNNIKNDKPVENNDLELKKEDFNNINQQNLNQDEIKEAQPIKRDEPKMGRNELVTITDGQETKEVKYKKAKALIESGEWRII
jgi:preprotein translocase subunit SecA